MATIFALVMQNFERLPSPLQLAHVSRRWRSIANTTPSLWRDLRVLRVWEQAFSTHRFFMPPVLKAPTLVQDDCVEEEMCSAPDGHHLALVKLCGDLSRQSLTHFEMEMEEFIEANKATISRIFGEARRSQDSIQSLYVTHISDGNRLMYADCDDPEMLWASAFASLWLDLVFHCHSLVDLELNVGHILRGHRDQPSWQLSEEALSSAPTPSLRRLQIDFLWAFLDEAQGPRASDLLLKRAALLSTLVVNHISNVALHVATPGRAPFGLRVLANCANTLVELETSGYVTLLEGAKALGTLSFPVLRRFRHATTGYRVLKYAPGDLDGMSFPQLELLEAPADIIAAFPTVPAQVTLRLDTREGTKEECEAFSSWLLSLGVSQSPRSVAVLLTYDNSVANLLHGIIGSLTPSRAGKVACTRLAVFKILFRAGPKCEGGSGCHHFEPVSLPKPVFFEEWYGKQDVSLVSQMERERRHLSQGLALGSSSSAAHPGTGDASARGVCEALTSIELEGCWISPTAWSEMKASPCTFMVIPNPEEMADLLWRSEAKQLKRKRGGEEEAHRS